MPKTSPITLIEVFIWPKDVSCKAICSRENCSRASNYQRVIHHSDQLSVC